MKKLLIVLVTIMSSTPAFATQTHKFENGKCRDCIGGTWSTGGYPITCSSGTVSSLGNCGTANAFTTSQNRLAVQKITQMDKFGSAIITKVKSESIGAINVGTISKINTKKGAIKDWIIPDPNPTNHVVGSSGTTRCSNGCGVACVYTTPQYCDPGSATLKDCTINCHNSTK